MPKHLMLLDCEHASTGYHDGGAVAVVADSLDDARELVASSLVCDGIERWHKEHSDDCYGVLGYEHDDQPPFRAVFELAEDHPPIAIFFPDSGCC